MPLVTGKRLGPYEIQSALGAGGMGEVYKALDTRLDRIVAIKILPEALAADPEFRDRFDREARTVAALNHPHICTLHDVGHQDGIHYLVMEYLEGETLADRLQKGALSLDVALARATEIGDALDKAHRAGIVHRDLKPGNIMLTKAGAKLLDFGLAKKGVGRVLLSRAVGVGATGPSSVPTTPPSLTAHGMILGTFQYMAPEQIEGYEADARTDIFAFGAVLHEMLTGKKAFEGKSHMSLMAAILEHEPHAVSSVQPQIPPLLDRLVRKCMAKDPDKRWQSASDLLEGLQWIRESAVAVSAMPHRINRWKVAALLAIVLVLVIVAVSSTLLMRAAVSVPGDPSIVRFQIAAPNQTIFSPAPADLSISPDGRQVIFAALDSDGNQVLWLRTLDSITAHPLGGTEDAFSPFWSPDSQQIAFFAKGKMQRIRVADASFQTICDAPDGRGGTWNREGVIVFARSLDGPLYRVAAVGGMATPLTSLDQTGQESGHMWPQFLPDGDHYLYLAWSSQKDKRQIRIGSLKEAGVKTVLKAESNVSSSQGRLIFVRGGALVAQPFDLKRLETTGEPFVVAESVWTNPATGRASFAASEGGVLVYRNGINFNTSQLEVRDRQGKLLRSLGEPGAYGNPSLSPDGKQIAVDLQDYATGARHIWTLGLDRGNSLQMTFGTSTNFSPTWLPNGMRILFLSNRDVTPTIYRTEFGGTGMEEVVFKSEAIRNVLDWSPSGQAILYETVDSKTRVDVWMRRLIGEQAALPFLNTEFSEIHAQLSPDGRWLAYSSDESARYEVYVQKFPAGGGKQKISTAGGMQPKWNPNGKEMFYLAPDRMLMTATVHINSEFKVDAPQRMFQTNVYGPSVVRSRNNYVVGPNGDTFITNSIVDSKQPINVVTGWTSR